MRKIALAVALSLFAAEPAFAACAAIPALPDTERRTEYTGVSSTTGPFNVSFQLYGDSSDYANWLEVWVNGAKKTAVTDYTVTSPSGTLGTLCLPISDAQVTFIAAQSGTIEILGARRPRRTSQLAENAGVTAHAFNQLNSDIIAGDRERWDLKTRLLFGPPGETISGLPKASTRANGILGFDSTGLIPTMLSVSTGLGTVIGPNITVAGNLVTWNSTNGTVVADSGVAASSVPFLSTNNTWTGRQTFSPTSGTAITINPASGLNKALVTNETVTGTYSATSELNLLDVVIADSATVGGGASFINGLTVSSTLSGLAGGNKQAIQGRVIINGGTSSLAVVGTTGQVIGAANIGGTNTGAGAAGFIFGGNFTASLSGTATNYSEVAGAEFNIEIPTGTSVRNKVGLSIIPGALDRVQGANIDTAIAITNASASSPGWKVGIDFGADGSFPIASTGTLLRVIAGTMATGIDMSATTISGNAWTSPSASLTGVGAWTAASYNKVAITAPATASTLTIANGKTLTANSSLTLAGTDAKTLTVSNSGTLQGGDAFVLSIAAAKTVTHSATTTFGGTDGKTLTVSNSGTLAGGDAFTLAIAASKTLTVSNSLTFTGTDTTSFAFPAASDTVGGLGTSQTWTNQNQHNVARTIASATAAALDDLFVNAATTTITGNTGSPITKLNKVSIGQPTLTDASAVTVTDAASLYIDNAPVQSGSVTITNAWALRIASGKIKFGDSTASTTTATGSLQLAGGLGAAGAINGTLSVSAWDGVIQTAIKSVSGTSVGQVGTVSNHAFQVIVNNAAVASFVAGLQIGAPSSGDPGTGSVSAQKYVQTGVTTVASLPTCNGTLEASRYYVSDQNTAVAYRGAVTGGGATRQAVLCSNSAWIQD